jgi:hypothetical protein
MSLKELMTDTSISEQHEQLTQEMNEIKKRQKTLSELNRIQKSLHLMKDNSIDFDLVGNYAVIKEYKKVVGESSAGNVLAFYALDQKGINTASKFSNADWENGRVQSPFFAFVKSQLNLHDALLVKCNEIIFMDDNFIICRGEDA